jgi:uncharacterized linocin/CFP29 family protein
MDHLRRELAPVSDEAWAAIDAEASSVLRQVLAARPLVDFEGPKGWEHAAHSLGRVTALAPAPRDGVAACIRQVMPLVEFRTPFALSLTELDTIERGNKAPDLDAVRQAANQAGLAEDNAVFHGFAPGGIVGIAEASAHDPVALTDDYTQYPRRVAEAVAQLRDAGIGGPYGLALGPRCYTGVTETDRGGNPLLEHIRLIVGGNVMSAPGVDGAVVLSLRGGDFALIVGEDFSVGYAGDDGETVKLYLEESFTFEVREERAAVALRYS